MITCSFDNSTCYKLKTVPVINSINAESGYTSGGQTLTISGYGLESDDISVKVGDTPCTVKSHSLQTLTCLTQASEASDPNSNFVGSQGLQWYYYTSASAITSFSSFDSMTATEKKPAMSFELPQNVNSAYSGNVLKGYFRAPATTSYRFYMSCDDKCILNLSDVNMSTNT
jgi:hypothetical protein